MNNRPAYLEAYRLARVVFGTRFGKVWRAPRPDHHGVRWCFAGFQWAHAFGADSQTISAPDWDELSDQLAAEL